MRKLREPKDESGVTREAIVYVQRQSTERLIEDLNQRVLRVRNPDLKDKCLSLGMQLAFAFGIDDEQGKAVGA